MVREQDKGARILAIVQLANCKAQVGAHNDAVTDFSVVSGMLFLPKVQGRFPVGVTTFATPIRPSRTIGSAKLKGGESSNQSALILEEVAFTAYYPADINAKSKEGIPWFLRPIQESLRGFATFLGIPGWLLWPVVYCFGAFIRIPGYVNAPLLDPLNTNDSVSPQWPLVIFSHGLGGGRTTYSQFCSQLAASGKVVLAVEHRDGTGTVCMPRSWTPDGRTSRTLYYLKDTDIRWDDNDDVKNHPIPLRTEQLMFRHHEVNITYAAFCRFIRNDPTLELDTIDGTPYDKESWLNTNEGSMDKVRYDDEVILTGHSFGGCTVLSLLSTEPSNDYPHIPVNRAIILDPWLEPLPSPGPTPVHRISLQGSSVENSVRSSLETAISTNQDSKEEQGQHPRILVINSETFTLWKDHFARLQEIISGWGPQGGRILTLIGSEHVSFSDFPVLPIIRKKFAQPILNTISKLSLAFLDNVLDETIKTVPTTNMEIKIIGVKKDGKPKRKLIGNPGDVISH